MIFKCVCDMIRMFIQYSGKFLWTINLAEFTFASKMNSSKSYYSTMIVQQILEILLAKVINKKINNL